MRNYRNFECERTGAGEKMTLDEKDDDGNK